MHEPKKVKGSNAMPCNGEGAPGLRSRCTGRLRGIGALAGR